MFRQCDIFYNCFDSLVFLELFRQCSIFLFFILFTVVIRYAALTYDIISKWTREETVKTDGIIITSFAAFSLLQHTFFLKNVLIYEYYLDIPYNEVLLDVRGAWSAVSADLNHIAMCIFLTRYLVCVMCNVCNTVMNKFCYFQGPSWSWLYGSFIYSYLCSQWFSPPQLWIRILQLSVVFFWHSGFLHQ